MKPAPILANEEIRLNTLHRYQVLDTAGEQVFDDITQLAASICQTPIALVSLIDSNRQWFKSRHGLDAAETPRDVSFCGHAIHECQIFEIKDALADSRFADNPLVTGGPVVRFYAGAPLIAPNGLAVGTLCVIDHTPKQLSDEQKSSLGALARHVVSLMELRISNDGAMAANARLISAQKNLEENKRFLNNVLDALPHLVSYMDGGLAYRYVNTAYEQWFGLKSENILGKTMFEVLGENAVKLVRAHIDEALAGRRVEFERSLPYKYGGKRDIHVTYLPDRHPSGSIDGFIAVVRDITEANKNQGLIKDQQDMLDSVIHQVPSAIVLKDAKDLKFTMWNKSAEQILMRPSSEVLGKSVYDLYPKEMASKYEAWDRQALTAKKLVDIPAAYSNIPEKGDAFLRIRKIPILPDSAGEYRYILTVLEDVTTEKKIRDDLIRANEEAMAATKSKAEFLANMSHEIRTPMNGVIGMTNLLLGDDLNNEQIERLKIIQNCGHSLLDLINDVLDFSKLEAGKVELEKEPFDVYGTTSEIVELFKGRASEKGVTLTFAANSMTPSWVLGDSTRFRQILTNLVSNAIKFTQNGRVDIGSFAKQLPDKAYQFQFSVKDSGIGIPDELKKKLFTSFSQADASTTRRFGGTGLGLAICKGLCEKMGGTIWVESEAGKGSTFSFTFVANETIAQKSEAAANPFATLDPKMAEKNPLMILVVEDNRTNQLVATGLLAKLGYLADVAGNGREALECIARKKYDLVLMDCHMPVMDGFETTRRILAQSAGSLRPRIVALTASMMKEDIEKCQQCGMDGFIGKPIAVSSLVKTLTERHFASEKSQESLRDSYSSFNRATFMSNFQGIEDLARQTIFSFLYALPNLLSAVEDALRSKKASELELSAHALRGAVSNFYAEPAQLLAWKLEQMGHGKVTEDAQKIFEELKSELQKLVTELQILANESKAA